MNPIHTKPDIPVIPPGGIQRPTPNTQPPNTPPTIYVIRHGEKNTPKHHGDPGDDSLTGLNFEGDERAAALPYILNSDNLNAYDIRLIIANQPQPDGDQERPFQTILPLFLSLLQTRNDYCLLDNTVRVKDVDLAAKRLNEFIKSGSPGNILLCWEHHALTDILESFEFGGAPIYPDSRFDVVWELNPQPPSHPKDKNQWTYSTIKWSTEGTKDDLPEINVLANWIQVTGAPKTLDSGYPITTAKGGQGPVFEWPPPKKSKKSDDDK